MEKGGEWMSQQEWRQEGLNQLSEKQSEEMDQMLARRYGLPIATHTEDKIRSSNLSELFSGLPINNESKE
ncbi:MAG TPA: hypothetical protein VJ824_12275 [Bacillota bacterium]|nr:hypothetical protein [Bacillota bacterium]